MMWLKPLTLPILKMYVVLLYSYNLTNRLFLKSTFDHQIHQQSHQRHEEYQKTGFRSEVCKPSSLPSEMFMDIIGKIHHQTSILSDDYFVSFLPIVIVLHIPIQPDQGVL